MKNEIQELLDMFSDNCGFGDSEARKNVEQRLQILLAKQQQSTANKLNWLTFFLVIEGLFTVLIAFIK